MMKSLFCTVAACMSLSAAAADDNYPTRPVRLLVPFAPGGGADALSRIITPKMHDSLGQAWVVDNRGGAAGNIAAETVAESCARRLHGAHGVQDRAHGKSQPLQAAL